MDDEFHNEMVCAALSEIREANDGDVEAARRLMERAGEWLRNGFLRPKIRLAAHKISGPMPEFLRVWIADALTDIGKGADPIHALKLKNRRGRNRRHNKKRNFKIFARVDTLRKLGLPLKSNRNFQGALVIAANDFNLSEDEIKKIYLSLKRETSKLPAWAHLSLSPAAEAGLLELSRREALARGIKLPELLAPIAPKK